MDGAIAALDLAVATLPPADPAHPEWARERTVFVQSQIGVLLRRGNEHYAQGQLAAAVADYGQAIDLMVALRAALEPAGQWAPGLRNALAVAYSNRGNALANQGQLVSAVSDFGRAIAIAVELGADLARVGDWTPTDSMVAAMFADRGAAHRALGRLDEAVRDFAQAIGLLERLRDRLEPRGRWTMALINDLAMAYSNRAAALSIQDRYSDALADYDRAIDLRKTLREALEPRGHWTPEHQIELAKDYINRGAASYGERSCEQVVADYEAGFALSEPIAAGVLAEADRARFVLYAHLSRLLDHLPDPLSWARAGSQRMVRILEPTPVTEEALSFAPELFRNFSLFHARWLAWCVRSGHLDVIPEILAIVQGREIAAEILDQVNVEDRRVPKPVRGYHSLRQELRKLNGRIEALSKGGHDSRLSGLAGFRRRVGALAPIWDPSTYEKLVAKHKGLTEQIEIARQKAAGVPGYESLGLPYQRLALADLQQRLAAGEALLLLVHPEEGEAGVLLIRAHGEPHWQPVPELPALTRRVRDFAQDGRGRGYRRGGIEREARDAPETGEADPATFWDTTAERLQAALWAPLTPHLDAVAQLIAVPHGDLHLLPLSAGVPARVTLSRFPGLAFFGLRRGLYGGSAGTDEAAGRNAVGLIDFAGPAGDIPLVAAESAALKRLHEGGGRTVYHPSGYPEQAEPMGLLHIACHGHNPGDDDQDPRSHRQGVALLTGCDQEAGTLHLITQEAIIAGPTPPRDLYFSACFGGQTIEGLSGTPAGRVSACFRRNARWVAGALVPIPDLWSMVLAVLTHQAMLTDGWPLPRALAEGKRRLTAVDWYPDTAEHVRTAWVQPLRQWAASLVEELRKDAYWSGHDDTARRAAFSAGLGARLLRELNSWGLEPAEIAILQLNVKRHGADTLPTALAEAIAERWLSRPRFPPQPHLGTLIHGLVVFGEPLDHGASAPSS